MKIPESNPEEVAFKALDGFSIEIPSWGFANTGTRFGKFMQPAAAWTIEEKFADAAEVNRLTGATPTLALHVLWDLPNGLKDVPEVKRLEKRFGIRSGSINPNLFQDQEYKFGSLCNPSAGIRERALTHLLDSIEIAKALGFARHFSVDGGRIELSGNAKHAQADRLARRCAACCARPPCAEPAFAGGIQTL